ncbi:J domain-containing protein [Oricola thermophila]|uniref:DnaJ family molecular chaperone n=1 Tax=Oricola thermophila TaxID=2742145 RepID=A0A6N1VBW1_9HYPH|nr:DnaJ family molecular chaperone [Oricola thermophila]QKV18370.1 DnaJ family molecular chaperone [Oricola thermophila]
MSIWVRISDFVSAKAATALTGVVEAVRTAFAGDPETRRRVAFSIAMIALSAKMAKADGIVTDDEVEAFREIFEIPAEDARRVASLYNLAKQDVAGYRAYARQVADLCGTCEQDCPLLIDVLDGLFHIAKADGVIHRKELDFLADVAGIFGISGAAFDRIVARHVDRGARDPWRILDLEPNVSYAEARKRYMQLVRENHPDQLIARGLPEEFIKIANDRIAAINDAWETVEPELKRA